MKERHEIGDIIVIDGKKYIITYVDGFNYSYAPYEEPVKRRRKKNG